MDNLIDTTLSAEAIDALGQHLKGIRSLIPFRRSATDDERKTLQSIRDRRYTFALKARDLSKRRSDFLRRSFDPTTLDRDVILLDQLRAFKAELVALVAEVDDTTARVGAEAYDASRLVYQDAQKSGDASLKTDIEDLGALFKKASSDETVDGG